MTYSILKFVPSRMGRVLFTSYVAAVSVSVLTILYVTRSFFQYVMGDEFFLLIAASLFIFLIATISRLHDLNLSGKWVLLFPILAMMYYSLFFAYAFDPSLPKVVEIFINLLPWFWSIPVLGLIFIPGTKGVNRFG